MRTFKFKLNCIIFVATISVLNILQYNKVSIQDYLVNVINNKNATSKDNIKLFDKEKETLFKQRI